MRSTVASGVFSKFKCRLVILGHRQIADLHYNPSEIFSPVAAITTGKMALSMAATLGWDIRHSDVSNAFIQAPLNDDLFIHLPKGMNDKDQDGFPVVYKCLRSIYGAKQAPRKFYNLMLSTLLSMRFVVSLTDPCLFIRNTPPLPVIVIVLIVDDLLELSPSTEALLEFEKAFAKVFTL